MQKLKQSLAAKTAAILLFILFFTATACGALGGAYMASEGYYEKGVNFYDSELCRQTTKEYADKLYYEYFQTAESSLYNAEDAFTHEQAKEELFKINKNFFFTLVGEDGNTLISYYETQHYGAQYTFEYGYYGEIRLNAYVKDPLLNGDNYYQTYELFNTLCSIRYPLIAGVSVCALISLLLFLFLMSAAGHRKDREGIVLNPFDKIPLDLYAAGVLGAVVLLLMAYQQIPYMLTSFSWIEMLVLSLLSIPITLLGLASCLTFAVRVKAGKWWKNTITWRVLGILYKALRAIGKSIRLLTENISLLWKAVLAFGAYLFSNLLLVIFLVESYYEAPAVILGMLFNFAVLLGICYAVVQMQKIKIAGLKIAGGDLNWKINTEKMLPDIRTHAENLNNISEGMAKAVEERLKSERMKTELITNVSHDIKTPLTSIINYVDLLKKEPMESPEAKGYIEILERQAARLKKLTEDLVEASKASTGNIQMNLEQSNLVELLNQSVGEYKERFDSGNLEIVIALPQTETNVLADGKLLWRIFDNLLNNIVKYSQPATRVYIDISAEGGMVTATLRNISRYPLNIKADDLMERFVRGDSSRTTEGSGLGLSIAKSLTELQKGKFDIAVDGDLFKAFISFPAIT